jgi:hypothetical protein
LPLARALLQFPQSLVTNSAVKRAVGFELAGDGVLLDQFADEVGAVAEQVERPLAVEIAEFFRKIVGHDPHAGINQPDIAAGTAKADLGGLEENHVDTAFRQMQGRGETGVTAADDHHVRRR